VSVGDETMHVIGYMKNFLFHPAQMRTPVSVLSGGEQARLFLARGLRQASNLLVMDEPTNDLDLETLDLLQEMIAAYEGTVILVSHDRDFLDRTVTSVFHSEGEGQWLEYAGGYSDMKAQQKKADKQAVAPELNKSADKNIKADIKAETGARAKLSYKQKYRLEKLPEEMAQLETDIAKAEALLADADLFAKDPERFNALAQKLEAARTSLAACEEEWLVLEMEREAIEAGR
jgi:ATP-binding cassette subfamily F protein uup